MVGSIATRAKGVTKYLKLGILPIVILKLFAWVDLAVSIIGGIWFLNQTGSFGGPHPLGGPNPLGIGIGFVLFLQGIVVCAFFLVIASMAENLIAIRQYLRTREEAITDRHEDKELMDRLEYKELRDKSDGEKLIDRTEGKELIDKEARINELKSKMSELHRKIEDIKELVKEYKKLMEL